MICFDYFLWGFLTGFIVGSVIIITICYVP